MILYLKLTFKKAILLLSQVNMLKQCIHVDLKTVIKKGKVSKWKDLVISYTTFSYFEETH